MIRLINIKFISRILLYILFIISISNCISSSYTLSRNFRLEEVKGEYDLFNNFFKSSNQVNNKKKYYKYSIYSNLFISDKIIDINLDEICSPAREIEITILRPFISSIISYLNIGILYRKTELIISCE